VKAHLTISRNAAWPGCRARTTCVIHPHQRPGSGGLGGSGIAEAVSKLMVQPSRWTGPRGAPGAQPSRWASRAVYRPGLSSFCGRPELTW
jgi:hypothetical protein